MYEFSYIHCHNEISFAIVSTIASGVRNTDQSSLKCSAVQVLHQDIESFNTNKPVLFHA